MSPTGPSRTPHRGSPEARRVIDGITHEKRAAGSHLTTEECATWLPGTPEQGISSAMRQLSGTGVLLATRGHPYVIGTRYGAEPAWVSRLDQRVAAARKAAPETIAEDVAPLMAIGFQACVTDEVFRAAKGERRIAGLVGWLVDNVPLTPGRHVPGQVELARVTEAAGVDPGSLEELGNAYRTLAASGYLHVGVRGGNVISGERTRSPLQLFAGESPARTEVASHRPSGSRRP